MLAAPETPLHVAVTVNDCGDAFTFAETMADDVGLLTAIRIDALFDFQVKLQARETSVAPSYAAASICALAPGASDTGDSQPTVKLTTQSLTRVSRGAPAATSFGDVTTS